MSIRSWFASLGIWAMLSAMVAAAPLKALIVDGQNNHDWKATTPILKDQLEQTGLFSVDVVTSPPKGKGLAGFHPKFADYDVVVSNYGYGGELWPEDIREALEKYVSGGGGLVIYHSANNAFPEWKAFNEMAGLGGWGGRNEKDGPYVYWKEGKIVRDMTPGPGGSHGPQHEFTIDVREPNHPITRGLPERFMHAADELYNRLRGPAKNMTVLATAFSPKEQRGTDRHEPMLMTIRHGKGRVFHTAFGHGPQQLRSVAFIATFQRGTEWAATGKVTQEIPADFPGPDKPVMRP